jgi:hypothetical protein
LNSGKNPGAWLGGAFGLSRFVVRLLAVLGKALAIGRRPVFGRLDTLAIAICFIWNGLELAGSSLVTVLGDRVHVLASSSVR